MIKSLNTAIAKNGMWIFLGAATYKFVFLIIDIVNSFKYSGARGVETLFEGSLNYVMSLVTLAILLELSAKLAGVVIESKPKSYQQPINNFNGQMGMQQAPVQPAPVQPTPAPVQQAPVQQAPVQEPTAPQEQGSVAGVWFCSSCGTQNEGASNFCYKCGKPK